MAYDDWQEPRAAYVVDYYKLERLIREQFNIDISFPEQWECHNESYLEFDVFSLDTLSGKWEMNCRQKLSNLLSDNESVDIDFYPVDKVELLLAALCDRSFLKEGTLVIRVSW